MCIKDITCYSNLLFCADKLVFITGERLERLKNLCVILEKLTCHFNLLITQSTKVGYVTDDKVIIKCYVVVQNNKSNILDTLAIM